MNAETSSLFAAPDGEAAKIRRRRLLFRCWHRGTQESDLILGSFAERYLTRFDDLQLDRFETLLDCSDPDLFDWIFGAIAPSIEHDHDVFRMLRNFCVRLDRTRMLITRPQTAMTL